MFRDPVSFTDLINIGEAMCNIEADNYGGCDVSLISTMRALLYDRTKGESIYGKFDNIGYSISFSRYVEKPDDEFFVFLHEKLNLGYTNCIKIVSVNTLRNEKVSRVFDITDSTDVLASHGFYKINKITTFFKKAFRVSCIVNEENKTAVLFVDNMDLRKLHYVECSLLACLPWYFKPGDKLSDDEIALVNSLRESTQEPYLEAIKKIASRFDFRSENIKRYLDGFEKRYSTEILNHAMREIEQFNNRILEYRNAIKSLYDQKYRKNIEIMGLQNNIDKENENEVMEFFLNNKNVYLRSISGSSVNFFVESKIMFWDETEADISISNLRSCIYMNCSERNITSADLQILLKAIFLDRKMSIKTIAEYSLDIIRGAAGRSSGDYVHFGITNCMPNPHVNEYSCIGTNESSISDALSNRQYSVALQQIVYSASQITWNDSTVIRKFGEYLTRDCYGKIIEDENGNAYTVKEAIRLLKGVETDG